MTTALHPIPDGDLLDAYSRAVIDVVECVGPAVVSLSVRGAPRRRGRTPEGAGSGVLVAPDGYLLTNSHVVQHGDARAILNDGTRARAQLVGDDPATDLALLRIDGGSHAFAPLAPPVKARQGQLAIAMGNPLGFDSTVSTGVVSAVGRSLRARSGRLIDSIVQHTAPLNPGSSGGPLLDSAGRILGINTAIIAFSQGIGFAVPATTAAWVVSELLAHGRVRRAWLGIAGFVRPLGRRLARARELTLETTVEVAEVQPNSPAAEAGLRQGDRIVAFDGTPTPTVDDLHRQLRNATPGRAIELTLLRGTEKHSLTITPREAS
ncbi:MAG TPA: trypsin-like peptidase domain-containing protein [Polyangiaceae bacterium]|jgi:S1-C subfamily serine protease|nr:trypsin-like peptidase domain-containing protein [Polyangiaceae bacterium]